MGGCVKKNRNTEMVCTGKKGKVKYGLHPLIHTWLEFYQAQDFDKKSGAKDSAFS